MNKKDIINNSNGDLKSKVYAHISYIAQGLESSTAKVLKEFNLSKLQLDILHELNMEEILTVNEIKERMLSDSPNVSRSINKLMENGYVEKERNLKDQRVVKIKITEEGKKIHHDADKARLSISQDKELSIEEYKTLFDLLNKL